MSKTRVSGSHFLNVVLIASSWGFGNSQRKLGTSPQIRCAKEAIWNASQGEGAASVALLIAAKSIRELEKGLGILNLEDQKIWRANNSTEHQKPRLINHKLNSEPVSWKLRTRTQVAPAEIQAGERNPWSRHQWQKGNNFALGSWDQRSWPVKISS